MNSKHIIATILPIISISTVIAQNTPTAGNSFKVDCTLAPVVVVTNVINLNNTERNNKCQSGVVASTDPGCYQYSRGKYVATYYVRDLVFGVSKSSGWVYVFNTSPTMGVSKISYLTANGEVISAQGAKEWNGSKIYLSYYYPDEIKYIPEIKEIQTQLMNELLKSKSLLHKQFFACLNSQNKMRAPQQNLANKLNSSNDVSNNVSSDLSAKLSASRAQ